MGNRGGESLLEGPLTAALTLGWREARQLAAVVQIYKALGGGWEVEAMADRDLPRGKAGSRILDVTPPQPEGDPRPSGN